MKQGFFAFCALVVGLYAVSAWRGWEIFSAERDHIPQSVRSAPGGYRAFGYWRGGK